MPSPSLRNPNSEGMKLKLKNNLTFIDFYYIAETRTEACVRRFNLIRYRFSFSLSFLFFLRATISARRLDFCRR